MNQGLSMLASIAYCAVVTGMCLVSALLSSCGIYGDWITSVAVNHSNQTIVVTAARGPRVGSSYKVAPTHGLNVMGGGMSYYVTIRTDSPNPRILFAGHLCNGDWILNGNDAVFSG